MLLDASSIILLLLLILMAQIVYNILSFTIGQLFVNDNFLQISSDGWFTDFLDYQCAILLHHLGAATCGRSGIRRATRFLSSCRTIDDRTIDYRCRCARLTLLTANIFCLQRCRLLRCCIAVGRDNCTIIDCGWSIGRCNFTDCWCSVLETTIQLFCCVIAFDWLLVVICLCGSVPCALPRSHGITRFSFKFWVIFEDVFVVPLDIFPMVIDLIIG